MTVEQMMIEPDTCRNRRRIEMSLDACRHGVKLVLGVMTVLILFFLTGNVRGLVDSIKTQTSLRPLAPVVPVANCTQYKIDNSVNIRVDICGTSSSPLPVIAFYLDNNIFRAYSGNESAALVSWFRRCSAKEPLKSCPIFSTRSTHQEYHGPQCLYYSPFNEWDYLCFNHNYELEFVVLDGFRFSNWETSEIVSHTLGDKWIMVLE